MSEVNTPAASDAAPFLQAIKDGDVAKVRALAGAQPDLIRATDPTCFGAPPLNLAVPRDDHEMVAALLALGADPNQKSDWWAGGFHPLYCVKDQAMADRLITAGALVDACAAAKLNMPDRLREILDAEPEQVHMRGGDGQLPLHFAATLEIAEFLLARGAEIDATDIDHVGTAAQWAIGDRIDVTRYLIGRGAKSDLFMLCAAGEIDRVRELLQRDPVLVNKQMTQQEFTSPGSDGGHIYCYTIGIGATPLMAAVRTHQWPMAEYLLSAGADIHAPGGYDDATALHFAAWDGRIEAARWLLDHGADIEKRSGSIHNNTPTGWSIVSGRVEMTELLLDRGAVIHDYYFEETAAGMRGDFKEFSQGRHEQFAAIETILRARKKP